ncbi:type IV-A pilus assembly ATPase PilB [Thalassotalea mangrovi]|uniref:Type IV-A pilus assembly ATPase PilB n=1 Tax=Thalassotalea mangrovi TaxID=2572245 RepID=A0A4U1BAA3_9GAMM|nr:type IV-A pilus assembly ATPase PilB [Thalassotalea mangrovi]TKB47067.1 type IV-A pilus assembly ATPase PilB [Thalassotalea mangrovi]
MKGLHRQSNLLSKFVRSELINQQQATEIFKACQQSKLSVLDYIANELKIDSLTIAKTLSKSYGYPLVDLKAFEFDNFPEGLRNQKLVEKHQALPVYLRAGVLHIAVSDPTNHDALEEFQFNTGYTTEFILVDRDSLQKQIESYLDNEAEALEITELDSEELSGIDVAETEHKDDESGGENDAPIVVYINKILLDSIKKGASDLHFEPFEKKFRIRFRIDGVLQEVASPPVGLASRLTARLKVMSKLDIAERRVPQDGRIKLNITKNKAIDFRVSTLPTMWGEKVVMRILDSSSAKLGIDILGYEEEQKAMYMEALAKPQGMILVTGPTGSGKTVSLYTGLNILNTEERNISTAEDPVEINLEGVNQVQINNKAGLTFAEALKSFLRQDPDIVMVGEIRDLETAEIAIKAAQTGHLVLSTLHTNSAAETLTRLLNMGVPSYNVASSVSLIIAQRLARRLCSHCKEVDQVTDEALLEIGFKPDELKDLTIYKPVGCDECTAGYKGRVGIYEVMKISEETAEIIMQGGNSLQIATQAQKEGYNNLRQSALLKAKAGVTSLAEVTRVTA